MNDSPHTETEQCRNVLHIDWEADNAQGFVREDVARCTRSPHGHEGQHEGRDRGDRICW